MIAGNSPTRHYSRVEETAHSVIALDLWFIVDGSFGIVATTVWTKGKSLLDIRQGQQKILFSTQRKVHHTPACNTENRNAWIYTSSPLYAFMACTGL